MSDILALFVRKQNFSEYRRETVERAASSGPADQLKELKAKRARIVAELDAEIAKAKLRLAQQGIPAGATERRRIAEAELRAEKTQLDHDFATEVNRLHDNGASVMDITRMCGATSTSVFYQALNYSPTEHIKSGMTKGGFDASKHRFEYSDVSTVHRFGLSESRAIVRIHDTTDPENVAYVLRSDGSVLGGDIALVPNFDSERVDLLEKLLDGQVDPEDGQYRLRANPNREVLVV